MPADSIDAMLGGERSIRPFFELARTPPLMAGMAGPAKVALFGPEAPVLAPAP